jgi:hypothetical protein
VQAASSGLDKAQVCQQAGPSQMLGDFSRVCRAWARKEGCPHL